MRILDRLVAGNFLKLFLAFVIGAPLLFVVGDVVENLDRYLDRGIPAGQVAWAYLYQLPQFILWSFPIAGLIAAVFTIHSMTSHQEVVAAKAGGISFHRLVAPILLLAVLLTGGALWLSEYAPVAKRTSSELLEERRTRSDWRLDFVFQGEDGRTLAVRRLALITRTLESISMSKELAPHGNGNGAGPRAVHTVATQAHWTEAEGWTFTNGYLRILDGTGEEHTFGFGSLRSAGFTERPEELLQEPRDHEEMTYAELSRQVDVLQRGGGDPRDLLVRLYQKRAIPAATLVIILFGLPLATSTKRGGAAFGVGASLGSTILYMMILRVSGSLGATGNLDPMLAAWLPNSFFLLAGLVLFSRVRT